jgi:hypothetical protein
MCTYILMYICICKPCSVGLLNVLVNVYLGMSGQPYVLSRFYFIISVFLYYSMQKILHGNWRNIFIVCGG